MVTLTPELAGNSIIVLGISYVIVFVFQLYMLYLNWKQSKVKDTTQALVQEVKEIRKLIEKGLGKQSRK